MSKTKTRYPEIDDIREDLNSLKSNVVELTKHVQKEVSEESSDIKAVAETKLSEMKTAGEQRIKQVERRVKAKPAESIAIAFGAGLLASFLLSRR